MLTASERVAKRALAAVALQARNPTIRVHSKAISRLALFPNLGVALSRVHKNANTFCIQLFRQLDGGSPTNNATAKEEHALQSARLTTILGLGRLDLLGVRRNPYSRTLSAFLQKFRRPKYRERYGAFDLTREGFLAFTHWMADGGLDANPHWDLQTRRLFPVDWYDHLFRMETLNGELQDYLTARGVHVPPGALVREPPSRRRHHVLADERVAQFYTAESARIVATLFEADFTILGYDPEVLELERHP